MRKAVITLATGAAVAGAVIAVGGAAEAASSPIAACGGGSYHVIDTHALPGATVYLMYNGTTDCVVTWKTADVGTKTHIWAGIAKDDNGTYYYKYDDNNYAYYAGPVKVNAPHTCIDWGGMSKGQQWFSGTSHCG